MNIGITRISLIVLLVGLLGACSSSTMYHDSMMRGQVVQVQDDQVVVCIGTSNIEPGTDFDVFEVIYEGTIMEGTDSYRLEKVGTITLQSVVDDHFARGRITSGSVERHNEIELKE